MIAVLFFFVPVKYDGDRLWECGNLASEISKSLWKPFSGFHRDVISTPSSRSPTGDQDRVRGDAVPLAGRRSSLLAPSPFRLLRLFEAKCADLTMLAKAHRFLADVGVAVVM